LNLLEAIILGLVEGITEYLPISSTGHLIIASSLMGLDRDPETKAAVDTYTIAIQGGGILAVLGLYRVRVAQMWRGLLGRDAIGRRLLVNLFIAFLPAAIIGVTLDLLIDIEALLFRPVPVMAALALGGFVMLFLGKWQRRFFHDDGAEPEDAHSFVDIEHLTWRRSLLIGLLQTIAIWPGTSRSMMTIVGGMVAGMRPKHAAEFSFLLGLPTLGGACAYQILKDLAGDGPHMFDVLGVEALVLGTLVAAVSAALAIRWLVGYLSRHGVMLFGWYRLGLCVALVILWELGVVTIG
jgi:undecaprenyl-diphosphatase